MADTPTDLYAFGPRGRGPRPPRPGIDLFADPAGMVGPEYPPAPRGASTFGDLARCPLHGHYHTLPAGTPLPEGLAVIADGVDVDPASPHGPTHHTVYPAVRMSFERFVELYQGLPWKYGGKK